MILKYTITNKMISSIISISGKIGRIKEIRNMHKHIDFDMMCNVKNVQNILQDKGISYPDHIIVELITSKLPVNITDKDDRILKEEINKYRKIRDRKTYHPSNFKEGLHKIKNQKVEVQPQIPKEVIAKLASTDKFFLYRVAEFCDACSLITNQADLIQLWLITLFFEEYDMLLYFPYTNMLSIKSSTLVKKKRLIDKLEYEANTKGQSYILIEFYLEIIDLVLEQCLEMHYKLSRPVSGRVEMLRDKISEPFSRKDYMTFYKISNPAASLDLKKAVENGVLIKDGDKRTAKYWYRGYT